MSSTNQPRGMKTGGKILVLNKVWTKKLKEEKLWDPDYMVEDKKIKKGKK